MALAEEPFSEDLFGIPDNDGSSRDGAQKLADKINEYWEERGYVAGAYPVLLPYHKALRECGYGVKSSLVNGLPRKRLPARPEEA